MSDEKPDDAQKTEEPTSKKLEESRKKGQVALSREVNNWLMIFAGTLIIGFLSVPVLGDLSDVLEVFLSGAHALPADEEGLGTVLQEAYKKVLALMGLPLLFLVVIAFIGPFAQVGPLFAPEVIKPKLEKVSPIKGFGRLFSMRSIMEFVKGILKITIVGVVSVIIIYPYYDQFEHLVGKPAAVLMEEIRFLVMRMLSGILIVLIVVALIDLVFQRQQHQKQMRMTKQEVKDEYRQSEGDPHIKAKLRQLRMERGRQRMMQAVPEADVVITNPTHFSVALKYDPDEMEAPLCVAKGTDELALRIREVAREHDVIVYENPPLARSLYDMIEVDETIPPEHYKAVAEVISFVFQRKGKSAKRSKT